MTTPKPESVEQMAGHAICAILGVLTARAESGRVPSRRLRRCAVSRVSRGMRPLAPGREDMDEAIAEWNARVSLTARWEKLREWLNEFPGEEAPGWAVIDEMTKLENDKAEGPGET